MERFYKLQNGTIIDLSVITHISELRGNFPGGSYIGGYWSLEYGVLTGTNVELVLQSSKINECDFLNKETDRLNREVREYEPSHPS